MKVREFRDAVGLGVLSFLTFILVVASMGALGIGPFGTALNLAATGGEDGYGLRFSEQFFEAADEHVQLEGLILWPLILGGLGILRAVRGEMSLISAVVSTLPAAAWTGWGDLDRTGIALLCYTLWTVLVSWLTKRFWMEKSGTQDV